MEKTKLIHFYFKRFFDLKNKIYLIKIGELIVQSKNLVK